MARCHAACSGHPCRKFSHATTSAVSLCTLQAKIGPYRCTGPMHGNRSTHLPGTAQLSPPVLREHVIHFLGGCWYGRLLCRQRRITSQNSPSSENARFPVRSRMLAVHLRRRVRARMGNTRNAASTVMTCQGCTKCSLLEPGRGSSAACPGMHKGQADAVSTMGTLPCVATKSKAWPGHHIPAALIAHNSP